MIGNDHVRFGPGAAGKGPVRQAPRQRPTGTDTQHDLIAEVPGGYPGRRDAPVPGGDEVPHPGAYLRPGGIHAVQGCRVDLGQRPRHGGRGGDLAEQVTLVAQHCACRKCHPSGWRTLPGSSWPTRGTG